MPKPKIGTIVKAPTGTKSHRIAKQTTVRGYRTVCGIYVKHTKKNPLKVVKTLTCANCKRSKPVKGNKPIIPKPRPKKPVGRPKKKKATRR